MRELIEITKSTVDLTLADHVTTKNTDRLITYICDFVQRRGIISEVAATVLITLGFSMLHNQHINKDAAMEAADILADVVYSDKDLSNKNRKGTKK